MNQALVGWSDVDFTGIAKRWRQAPPVTVCVPVFNGGPAVAMALRTISRMVPAGTSISIIDDASDERVVLESLDELAAQSNVTLTRRSLNVGYTENVNEFLSSVPGDVLLVNSDAVPGPGWVARLRAVAYSRDVPSIASAMSDNAGSAGLPLGHVANTWPQHAGWSRLATRFGREMPIFSFDYPTAHGFCMYIPREVINAVGVMDVESFPRGYGEEVDYSMRARAEGFATLFAPHALVRHLKSMSFGTEVRLSLNAQSKQILHERYPGLRASVAAADSGPSRLLLSGVAESLRSREALRDTRTLALLIGSMDGSNSLCWSLPDKSQRSVTWDDLEHDFGDRLDVLQITRPKTSTDEEAAAFHAAVRYWPDLVLSDDEAANRSFATRVTTALLSEQ